MPRTGLTRGEQHRKWGREGMAVRLCMGGEAGRHAMAANARAGQRRNCAAQVLADAEAKGERLAPD